MDEASSHQPWYRRVLPLALFGSILMWAAQPPLSLWPLAWVAPVPWLLLVRRDLLTGRRPYFALWLAGFIFWLLAIHWVRLPHPALHLGWIALSAYLAFYIPLFVGLARVGLHRIGAPLWLTAPTVWTGLELARAHVLTGFLMGSLAHTQVNWTTLIQASDLFGEYGVDFIIMTVAASIACILVQPRKWFTLVPAAIVLGSALAYGSAMLEAAKTAASSSVRSAQHCSHSGQQPCRVEIRSIARAANYGPVRPSLGTGSPLGRAGRQTARPRRLAGDDVSHAARNHRPWLQAAARRHAHARGNRLLRPERLNRPCPAAEYARAHWRRAPSFSRKS